MSSQSPLNPAAGKNMLEWIEGAKMRPLRRFHHGEGRGILNAAPVE